MNSPRFTSEFNKEAVRQVTQRGCSVVDVADRVGTGCGLDFRGGSTIIDPMGNPLAHGGDQEGIDMVNIDPTEVERVRSDLPFLRARRF